MEHELLFRSKGEGGWEARFLPTMLSPHDFFEKAVSNGWQRRKQRWDVPEITKVCWRDVPSCGEDAAGKRPLDTGFCAKPRVSMCVTGCLCIHVLQPACLSVCPRSAACLRACLPACLSVCLPMFCSLRACLPASVYLPVCLPACLLAVRACVPACLPALLSGCRNECMHVRTCVCMYVGMYVRRYVCIWV